MNIIARATSINLVARVLFVVLDLLLSEQMSHNEIGSSAVSGNELFGDS